MRVLGVLVFCVTSLALSAPGRADEPKKADPPETKSPGKNAKPDANLLPGKWVRVDKIQGTGTTMEYFTDGTYTTTMVPMKGQKPTPMPGTWKLDGDKLIQTLGPTKTNVSVTIVKLSETEFHFRNHAGQDVHYERLVEKKDKN
jgi:uncharacterized protein (TIGR03066 family)